MMDCLQASKTLKCRPPSIRREELKQLLPTTLSSSAITPSINSEEGQYVPSYDATGTPESTVTMNSNSPRNNTDSVLPGEVKSDSESVSTNETSTSLPMFPTHQTRKLGIIPLAVIVFYNVSGGPFGIEPSVRAGGNLFALLGFFFGPMLWSFQEALLTAELGTMFAEAGAGATWVEEAFGPMTGWMCGFLGWVAGATDNAIYPVLFLVYMSQNLLQHVDFDPDLHVTFRYVLLVATSLSLGYINWRGLDVVGYVSIWIGVIAMSPFFIMIVIGLSRVDPKRWLELPNDDVSEPSILQSVKWGAFLNNLFWNLNSFDSAGSLVAEIDQPAKLFPKTMMLAVLMVAVCYILPLLVAIGASDSTRNDWEDGYLVVIVEDIGGSWLGTWTVFAAAVSNIGQFQAELSSDSYQLMGMADRGHLPKLFSKRSRHGTPTWGIVMGLFVILLMEGLSDLDSLIEMLNFSYAASLLMEYAAFFKLRIDGPHFDRPYRVPLSTAGSAALFSPSILLTLLILGLANAVTLVLFCITCLVGALLFTARHYYK